MKKILFIVLFAFLALSCSTSKSTTSSDKPSKDLLKGTWKVTNIRFVGDKESSKVDLFNIADSACFNGGQWTFTPNNGSGKFIINNSTNCKASTNRIHWSFFEPGDGTYQFLFKLVDNKNKPLDVANRGYKSEIDLLNSTAMVLRISTNFNGNSFDVVMTFSKISDEIIL